MTGTVHGPSRVAAVAGIGFTPFSRASGCGVLSLAAEAVANAVEDAGLRLRDVDAMGSFMVSDDSVPCVAVSSTLGMGALRSVLDLQLGGQAPCHLVWQAAQTVARGDAEVVVVYRALNGRSGARVGSMQFAGMGGQYRYPIGYGAYLMYVGMWAQRFLYETGQGPEDLGAVAVSQRTYAQANERAVRRQPLGLAEYLSEPYVVEPFRRSDCTVEVDGACAVVVTSLERARDLPHPPAVVASGCYRAGPRPGLDIGDHLLWEDYTRNYTSWLRDESVRTGRRAPGGRGRGRDLRLLHQYGPDGPGGTGTVRAGRVRSIRALGRVCTRRAAAHQYRAAVCWPKATCTA